MRGSEAARLSFATALARCSATDAASLSMVVDRRTPGCCDWWSSTTEIKDRRRLVDEIWWKVCGRRRAHGTEGWGEGHTWRKKGPTWVTHTWLRHSDWLVIPLGAHNQDSQSSASLSASPRGSAQLEDCDAVAGWFIVTVDPFAFV